MADVKSSKIEIAIPELMVRIAEAMLEAERPEGMSAREAIEAMPPHTQQALAHAAATALDYFYERMKAAGVEVHDITGMTGGMQ